MQKKKKNFFEKRLPLKGQSTKFIELNTFSRGVYANVGV